jgi:hypothetical protein
VAIISISLARFFGQVVVFGEILGHVVELPAGGVQLGQPFVRYGVAKTGSGLGERGPGQGQTARQPSW